ncbi:hypothetical protein GCM10027290_29640 [Micromonospora sonneratiae]
MSADSKVPQPHDLARELGRRSGAVAALVTLRNIDRATLSQLTKGAHDGGILDEDLNWLAAVGLLQRDSSGSWDTANPSATYQLSSLGYALANSLTALAKGYAATKSHSSPQIQAPH